MSNPIDDISEKKVAKLASLGVNALKIAELLRVNVGTLRERFGKLIEEKNEEYYLANPYERIKMSELRTGRPLADIDQEEVIRLASNGAKNAELAAYFGVDEETINRRFAKILTKTRSIRRMHLRGAQTDKALGGDTTMLIWLGKNDLDQTDRVEQQHSGGVTINVVYEDVEPSAAVPAQESDQDQDQDPYVPQGRPSPLL